MHEQMTKLQAATVDRQITLALLQLVAESTAQTAEMNELLRRTLGMVNVEKLALDLGEAVRIAEGEINEKS
jgi:hypothetical protein